MINYYILIPLPLAFLLEFYIGGIRYKIHPLNIMGQIAGFLEKIFYRTSNSFFSGALFNILTIFIIVTIFAGIDFITIKISIFLFYFFSIFILLSFLSAGGLKHESMKIYRLLKANDIDGARKNLLSLAGRDSNNLDISEISRSVVESVAENTGDGIGSVIFYFTAGLIIGFFALTFIKTTEILTAFGIISAVIYKTVNLLDSMVGYRNAKYEKFGKFSARLDDALNYIPFRITAYFMLLSVFILNIISNKYHNKDGFKSWFKFRKSHPSPNGGQLESIMAGALHIKLGGTNFYGGAESKRPIMGFENYGRANENNIISAVRIMELTSFLLIIIYTLVITLTIANF
ncbi:MAG: adenosylcobinamide-phosphate synthase CbiB [bacterium]